MPCENPKVKSIVQLKKQKKKPDEKKPKWIKLFLVNIHREKLSTHDFWHNI